MPQGFQHILRSSLLLLLGVLLATVTGAETISRVAAVVNDAIITTQQLDAALAQEQRSNPALKNASGAKLDEIRRQLLDRLIEEELLRQRIAELKLTVSDAEVDDAIADIQQQNNLTRQQLIAALKQQGMDFDTYRRNMHDQILRFKLIGREVQEKVDVSNSAIRDYYAAHQDDYRLPPYLRMAKLVFSLPKGADPGLIEASRSRAEEARKRLLKGDSIAALLATFKDVPGVDGGDMGKVQEKDLAPKFAAAVRNLQTGGVSDIVETSQGLYLFKVIERSAGDVRPLEELHDEIERQLLETTREERFKTWQADLKKAAYIDIRL